MWYRYFLAPPAGPGRKPAVSVTLLAGPLSRKPRGLRPDLSRRQRRAGRRATRSGRGPGPLLRLRLRRRRHALLAAPPPGASRVFGLYAQGEAGAFARQQGRPRRDGREPQPSSGRRPIRRCGTPRFALRDPDPALLGANAAPRGAKTCCMQFTIPPLAADKGGQTVHASLTLAVGGDRRRREPGTFYDNTRLKLGSAFDDPRPPALAAAATPT